MSAIDTHKRINSVATIRLQFSECQSYNEHISSNNSEVISPLNIRSEFIQGYIQFVDQLKVTDIDELSAMKMAFKKFAVEKYRAAESSVLMPEINKIMDSSTIDDFKSGTKALLPKLENLHAQLFQDMLSEACKKSAYSCHFKEITIKKNEFMTRVTAKNKTQELIISEVCLDNDTKDFIIRTETFGFKGKQCEIVLDRFEEELRVYGINSSSMARKLKHQPKQTINNQLKGVRETIKRRILNLKKAKNQLSQ